MKILLYKNVIVSNMKISTNKIWLSECSAIATAKLQ